MTTNLIEPHTCLFLCCLDCESALTCQGRGGEEFECLHCLEAVFDALIFGLMIQNLVAYVISEEAKFVTHLDRKKYSSFCTFTSQGCSAHLSLSLIDSSLQEPVIQHSQSKCPHVFLDGFHHILVSFQFLKCSGRLGRDLIKQRRTPVEII